MISRASAALLEQNLEQVKDLSAAAAVRSGRAPGDVTLVAITKGFPPSLIRQAFALGLRTFGENRVAEGLEKMQELGDLPGVEWHMVGHIQSRKAADVAPHFDMVHSIDRTKLAQRLDRFAGEAGRILPVLLECNVSGEDSKGGWQVHKKDRWPQAVETFALLASLPHLEIRGLMTMAPWTSDTGIVRPVFRRLKELSGYLSQALNVDWRELSMGMTDDYELAIEEGATMIRLGRALFGERP